MSFALLALGAAREPGCGGVDDPDGGPNAPCTRSPDCGGGLVCLEGVCREPDAGQRADEGRDHDREHDASGADPDDAGDGGR